MQTVALEEGEHICTQSSSGTRPWGEELVLIMGRHWGIPPLRIGIHGTKLVNQLRRNENGCNILVPWWEGGEVRRVGSMPERCAVGVGLLPEC